MLFEVESHFLGGSLIKADMESGGSLSQYQSSCCLQVSWQGNGQPLQRIKLSARDGCRWTDAFGDYVNGEPGQPLLASMLLYLDDQWPRDWGAETLFLDDKVGAAPCLRCWQQRPLNPADMSGRPSRGLNTRVASA